LGKTQMRGAIAAAQTRLKISGSSWNDERHGEITRANEKKSSNSKGKKRVDRRLFCLGNGMNYGVSIANTLRFFYGETDWGWGEKEEEKKK